MAYAIIETGGKQLRVETGRFYDVERLHVEEEGEVAIDRVLFIENEGDVSIGQPLVAGAIVMGQVLRHLRGRKIIVYKMRPKKKTRKKQGHRQELTRLMIQSIQLNGVVISSNENDADTLVKTSPVAPASETDSSILVEAETVDPIADSTEASATAVTPVEVVE